MDNTKWLFIYDIINSEKKLIALKGINSKYKSQSVLYIPSEYNGYKVDQVKMTNIANVKSVTVEEGVTSLSGNAFSAGKKLVSVKLPSSIRTIGPFAFSSCESLKSIELKEGITTIGREAFFSVLI